MISKRSLTIAIALVLLLSGCTEGDSNSFSEQNQGGNSFAGDNCETSSVLTRSSTIPIGVLMPSGSPERQSYTSAEEIKTAGLTAVSLGWTFYYLNRGELVFDFNGSADEDARQRWFNQMRCAVISAKEAGLVVSVWGQFQEAEVQAEPMGIPEAIRDTVLEQALRLMPEIAKALEELKVEYWSPVSELDKFAGIEGHNKYFAQMVNAGRPIFEGIIYSQPNILQRDGFYPQNVQPDLGGVDSLGISWISYECEPAQLEAADFIVAAARDQGISGIFISELGSTNYADDSAKPCLETLIKYWGGETNGVFVLDHPPIREGVAVIKGSWQEQVLRDIAGR